MIIHAANYVHQAILTYFYDVFESIVAYEKSLTRILTTERYLPSREACRVAGAIKQHTRASTSKNSGRRGLQHGSVGLQHLAALARHLAVQAELPTTAMAAAF